jgi:hypothetical protein
MTLTLGSRPQHLEDGDLVRYMDRQMDRAGVRHAELHLTVCAECQARLHDMQSRASLVSGWLGALDAAPVADERRALAMAAVERARFRARSHAWGGRPALAAAAMVALMLTVAFGTLPGRAWVGSAAERLGFGRLFPREEAAEVQLPAAAAAAPAPAAGTPVAESAPPAAAAPGVVAPGRTRRPALPPGMSAPVQFNPTGNYVLLTFESRQRAGSATIWIRDIPTASGQVVAGRQAEQLEPTGDGLRVRNVAGSRADYTVEIPTRYRFIRVRIGTEPETVINVSRARQDWLWTLSLTGTGG